MTTEQNKSPPQQAHTPGPYHVEDGFIFAANGLRIADTSCEEQDMLDGEDAANAAFIVRACNNHDELLEALEEALSYLDANPDEYSEKRARNHRQSAEAGMNRITENQMQAAIRYVRDPYGFDEAKQTMDSFELGARRLLDWLEKNSFVMVNERGQQ